LIFFDVKNYQKTYTLMKVAKVGSPSQKQSQYYGDEFQHRKQGNREHVWYVQCMYVNGTVYSTCKWENSTYSSTVCAVMSQCNLKAEVETNPLIAIIVSDWLLTARRKIATLLCQIMPSRSVQFSHGVDHIHWWLYAVCECMVACDGITVMFLRVRRLNRGGIMMNWW